MCDEKTVFEALKAEGNLSNVHVFESMDKDLLYVDLRRVWGVVVPNPYAGNFILCLDTGEQVSCTAEGPEACECALKAWQTCVDR